MKICSLTLQNINQFRKFHLDLTYPPTHPTKAGKPLDKICFIGSNGTGKSTLLEMIKKLQERYQAGDAFLHNFSTLYKGKGSIRINYKIKNHTLRNNISLRTNNSALSSNYDSLKGNHITPKDTEIDLLIHAPAESTQNLYKKGIPNVTVDESLQLFDKFPTTHIVSNNTINDFWKMLIYLIKKREGDLRAFESKEENLDKTVRQVQEEFGQSNPKILDKIAVLWNKILDKAGLEFDVEGASNPIQLTDNLNAYIKLKGTDQTIPYSHLSTGIRNFIFRVGHIYSLYFGRKITNGFLLVDEPENSLHPDFLYDLIGIYEDIIENTQFFVATHNPIVAAQFEPSERFILSFDEEGAVQVRRGVTPEGDDPNDILQQDFGVRNLLGEKGQQQWERFIQLQQQIIREQDQTKKRALLKEWMKIGNAYKFDVNEISE